MYALIISFAASLMIGVLAKDSKSAFFCVYASLILGSAIATWILVVPAIDEGPIKFDIALTITLSSIAKILLINVGLSFVGCLLGVLLGGKL